MRRARQRGVALLVAIVIFAVATLLAAAITYSKAMTARRAAGTFTMEQALQAGMAAEALASIALEKDGSEAQTQTSQDWAQVRARGAGRHRSVDRGAGRGHERPLQSEQRREVGRQDQDLHR
jgi:type II secretory pathway component PulK